ncbi:MAG: radical SAM protein [Thermoproteota archaeon]
MKQGAELTRFPTVREARFYEKTGVDETVCLACERQCRIKEGSQGFCGTRVNVEGKLYTIVYGDISSISVNPIEKKPFFHFHPGSYALTVGTWSCNFSCPWCLDPSTEVLLNDSYTIPIGGLEKCWKHHEIVTCNLEDKTLATSKIARYFKIDPRSKGLRSFRIVTKETGREIIATEEHPFYTTNGYLPLKDLKIGDRVAVYPMPQFTREKDPPPSEVIVTVDEIKKLIKKYIPRSNEAEIINVLTERSLLPLRLDNEKLPIIARLMGHLFGDGYLTLSHRRIRDSVSTVFTGTYEDLQTIRKDLEKLGFGSNKIIKKPKISKIVRYGKTHVISRKSVWMQCSSKPLWILMTALGVPIGDKAASAYHIPSWLFKAARSIKREFLAAFFGCELTKPRVGPSGKSFFQPRFSLNKLEKLHKNGIEFVHELRQLASEFGIKITSINNHHGPFRENGQKTLCIYVLFSNSLENLLNLYGKVGYRYNKEWEILARYVFEYLLMKKRSVLRWRALWEKALELRRAGLSVTKIIHELGENNHRAAIRRWIRYPTRTTGAACGYDIPKFQEWLKESKLGDEGLVWESIESIEPVEISDVRDLTTTESMHNFFANGFLVSNCQNSDISKNKPNPKRARYVSPEQFLEIALKSGCEGTSISFNEPTLLLEYSLDLFPLAREKRLYNTFVSNGYMTLKALEALAEAGLDAIKFDVKGDEEVYEKYCGGVKASVVWRNAQRAKDLGLHVEIVNLVIPGVNDDEGRLRQLVETHLRTLGPDTPLHFTRYHPEYRFKAPPTPVKTLEKAREIARSLGVLFPYVGNVPGNKYENTWCPECSELLIRRLGFNVLSMRVTSEGKCPKCGFQVPLVR